MNFRVPASIILFILLSEKSCCQIDSIFSGGIYDTILEESAEDSDDSELYTILEFYKNNPVNLNTVSLESLLQLPFIDYKTAGLIFEYKMKHGFFFSAAELFSIEELDKNTARKIIPFFFVGNSVQGPVPLNDYRRNDCGDKLKLKMRSRIVNDNVNEDIKKFSGAYFKQYNRILLGYNIYQFGLITEKDPGENSLLDFNSFHLAVKNKEQSSLFILGDYTAEFGQGLLIWGPYGVTRTSEISSIIKNDRNILPYSSTDENKFFRGMAFSISHADYNVSSFVSYRRFDAVINDTNDVITSMPQDGNHRTQSEINHDDRGKEFFFGGRIGYTIDSVLSVGILYCHSNFIPPLMLGNMSEELTRTDNYSLAYKYFYKDLFLAGEIAGSRARLSVNTSLCFAAGRRIQFVVSYRNYNNSLISPHSSIAAESGCSPENITGIYSGVKINTNAGSLNIYYDQFSSRAKGSELLLYYSNALSNELDISLKYKIRKKEETGFTVYNNARTELVYKINKELTLKSRFDFCPMGSDIPAANETGYSFYQDIRVRIGSVLTLNGRITYYNTTSYDSRLYEYENDLPGLVNNMVLFGKGIKLYFLLGYKLNGFADFSFKYHQDNRRRSGSHDVYPDDYKLSFQLDVNL